jgi:oligopeptide/dipeptide ABC transporter ATP-binding protein
VPAARSDPALLEVRGLCTVFDTAIGPARAVDGVDFELRAGETLGLVGESGCGKSVTALSILRLVPEPGRIVSGDVLLEGRSLLGLDERALRAVRGGRISMVFQDPISSLNPVLTCGDQVAEAVQVHERCGRRAARARAVEMLRRVHLPDPEGSAHRYPHQLSGGMCQRVMLAMALACRPSVLLADEPTTALDVTIQAQICELLREIQAELDMAILLITHDLGLVAEMAERVAIMYAGRLVETGTSAQLFAGPRHPYTRGLLASLPDLAPRRGPLPAIPGSVPHPARLPSHCRFHDRCAHRIAACATLDPPAREVEPGHAVRCLVDVDGEPPAPGGTP